MIKPRHKGGGRLAALVMALATTVSFATPQASSATSRLPIEFVSPATGGCATPKDYFVDYVDTVVVSSDSLLGVQSRQFMQLPSLPASSVSVVTDPVICHRALVAAGLSRTVPDSTVVPGVSVLRVGASRYVVTDTGGYMGEFQIHLTFDTAFTVPPLATWGH